jgi:hypothetical protein
MEDLSPKILRKRKPFRLLAKMDKTEIDQFRHFLESPLIHPKPDKKLIAFFDQCLKVRLWHADLDKPGFEKATRLVLTDNAFDKMVSKLYDQLTTYVGLVEYLEATPQHAQFALKYYEKKNLEGVEISKKVKEGKRELTHLVQNETYYHMTLMLELESAEKSASRTQTPDQRGFSGLHAHLDSYYFILKLRFLCASANEQRIFGDTGKESDDGLLLQWLQASYQEMPALAKVYYHAFHILKGIDAQKHTDEFRRRLTVWEAENPGSEAHDIRDLKGYLLNYYLRKLNAGELEVLPQVHHFYLEALHQGSILEDGKLSPEHFKNILLMHCRMNLIAEARTFFLQYKDRLTDQQNGTAIDYFEAVLEFNEKKYEAVIPKVEALIDTKGAIKADLYYGLDFRCLLLKAYIECLAFADLKQWDRVDEKLLGLLHAFPAYIARKNLPRTTQVRFDNFRKSIQRLYAIAYDSPPNERLAKMEELLRDLRSSSNLPDKGWFIQKAVDFLASPWS